jgi:hypothetical protein
MTPEGRVKLAISHYLGHRRDCFFWWQESVGQYDAKIGGFRKKKGMFQRNGIPDILLLLKVAEYPPVFVGLEVKANAGKQNKNQKKFEMDLKAFGSFYAVVKNQQEAHEYLEKVKRHILTLTVKT